MPLPFDEEIVLERESLLFRKQALKDRLEELQIMLNRVAPSHPNFDLMKKYSEEIECVRGELEAVNNLLAAGRMEMPW